MNPIYIKHSGKGGMTWSFVKKKNGQYLQKVKKITPQHHAKQAVLATAIPKMTKSV